jgi:flagellar protein FlbD
MIQLTRLNNTPFYLNCDLIEQIEERPDTIITLTSGKRILVAESAAGIVEKIIRFRSLCADPAPAVRGSAADIGGEEQG